MPYFTPTVAQEPLQYADTQSGNPLDDPKQDKKRHKVPDFNDEEKQYMSYLHQRFTTAQEARDRKWAEYSNKTYLQQYQENEKIAHTYIEPKRNEEEPDLSMGTIESKLNALLSHLDNLNLTAEVLAYDKNKSPLSDFAQAFTDVIQDISEHDGNDPGGDREKKMNRQRELLKQGTVFVQKDWVIKRATKKKLKRSFNGNFRENDLWSSEVKNIFEGIDTQVLYGPNVYLGDPTKFSMNEQPYLFTVEQMHFDKAKEIFGKFENFKYVTPGTPEAMSGYGQPTGQKTIYDAKYRFLNVRENHVEVIRYQDPFRDEFQIVLNDVPLLPIGFPLSEVSPGGGFTVEKQILYPVNAQFAYGKSFVSSGGIYEIARILDEMIRLFVAKTRKSITPPYINTSNKVISRRSLAPGNISMGISPNALQPIGTESQGVTSAEFQMFQSMQQQIEASTVSDIFQGQQGRAGTTATEVLEVQRQAKLTLGLIITACTMLEIKLGYKQLWIILSRWIKSTGKRRNKKGMIKNTFRSVSREVDIPQVGRAQRRVTLVDDELPRPEVVRVLERREEERVGMPVRRLFLSQPALEQAKINWKVRVLPKERETSATNKLQFREKLSDILSLVQIGSKPNVDGLQDRLAQVYNEDAAMLFQTNTDQGGQQMEQLKRRIAEAAGEDNEFKQSAEQEVSNRNTEGEQTGVNRPGVARTSPAMS